MTVGREKGSETGRENKAAKKERFLKSGFYDTSDVLEAAQTAYDQSLDEAELKKRRRRDWIFLLIGVPAFIAFMYLLVMLFKGAA